jgi:hypothetical protein
MVQGDAGIWTRYATVQADQNGRRLWPCTDFDVSHFVAGEDFSDDCGDRVSRPFSLAAEIPFRRSDLAARSRRQIWRSAFRPECSSDVCQCVADHLVGSPINRSDDFPGADGPLRYGSVHETPPTQRNKKRIVNDAVQKFSDDTKPSPVVACEKGNPAGRN